MGLELGISLLQGRLGSDQSPAGKIISLEGKLC